MKLKDRLGIRYNNWLTKTYNSNYKKNSANDMMDELVNEIESWLYSHESNDYDDYGNYNMINILKDDLR